MNFYGKIWPVTDCFSGNLKSDFWFGLEFFFSWCPFQSFYWKESSNQWSAFASRWFMRHSHWTSSAFTSDSDDYWIWYGLTPFGSDGSTNANYSMSQFLVRCVLPCFFSNTFEKSDDSESFSFLGWKFIFVKLRLKSFYIFTQKKCETLGNNHGW